ncbi:MAG: hypothetical protein WCW84_13925 [Sulfurimonas sp.]|jgi:hypothetical protein
MKRVIRIEENSPTHYAFYDGDRCIGGRGCSDPKYLEDDIKKMEIALSKVPQSAKYFWQNDPILKEYEGKLLGGWLCDSKVEIYGIISDRHISGYGACIFWELSNESIKELIDYPAEPQIN